MVFLGVARIHVIGPSPYLRILYTGIAVVESRISDQRFLIRAFLKVWKKVSKTAGNIKAPLPNSDTVRAKDCEEEEVAQFST